MAIFFYFILFTNLFNVDNLQILRYCKKLKNTIAYHIANLRQRKKKYRYELNLTKVLNKWPRKSTGTISWNSFLNFTLKTFKDSDFFYFFGNNIPNFRTKVR